MESHCHIGATAKIDRLKYVNTVLTIIICVITLILLSGCLNNKFYQPNQTVYSLPSQYNLQYDEVFFRSKDGTKLHGWYIPAVADAVGTIIYLHGNFGNLTYYFNQIYWIPFNNFNVFTFDYRGFGQSEGVPSRRGIYEDSVSAIKHITSKPENFTNNVYLFGQSIGGANAIVALANNNLSGIRAIAVEGTFYSYKREAQDMMASTVKKKIGNIPGLSLQIWPISFFLVTNSFSPNKFIEQISPIPILLIHCTEDSFVQHHHSEWLYGKAKEPKQLWINSGCSHLQLFTDNKTEYTYRQRLLQFFKDHRRE